MSSLSGKTLFITGASRGIGLAIAMRAARDGANIAIAAKTDKPHRILEGTIHTAAGDIEEAGGKALPLVVDVRDEENVVTAMARTAEHFGGIDILVNNASAISLTGTLDTKMSRYDLMHQVNARGSFLCARAALPYLLKAANPHILNISPPLDMNPKWFGPHVAYTMAKYGMSLCVLGMAEEFRGKVAVNALWPRSTIATAAVNNLLGGDTMMRGSRTPEIMADAAHVILSSPFGERSGNFYIDDLVLRDAGVTDFEQYRVDASRDLFLDFFLPEGLEPSPGGETFISDLGASQN
jgi:citronellol/citronellal dehydrogenase